MKSGKLRKIIKRGWTQEEIEETFEYILDVEDALDDNGLPLDENNCVIWDPYINKGINPKENGERYRNVKYHDEVPRIIEHKVNVTREVYIAELECGHKVNICESDKRKSMHCRDCSNGDKQ